jgi:hypothetical protein
LQRAFFASFKSNRFHVVIVPLSEARKFCGH